MYILSELNDIPKEDWKSAYSVIKRFYIAAGSDIVSQKKRLYFKAYNTPIWKFMNEVEQDFYQQLRSIGGLSLYPLYFVHGFFIDFANPFLKIGVEIDGKQFHDTDKDRERDEILDSDGWVIFRISAKDVLKNQLYLSDLDEKFPNYSDRYAQEALKDFFKNYCTGLIYALRFRYYDKISEKSPYYNAAQHGLYSRTMSESFSW